MKTDTGKKIRLGIFVTVGIAFFIIGIYYIGQKQRLFSSTIRIKTICKDVSGLEVGNNVRFCGINVGTVENIEISTDTTVQVDMIIDKHVKDFIKKDAVAGIGSEGLMGDKVVNLSSGSDSAGQIENNDFIASTEGNDIDQILGQVKITATNAALITGDIASLTSNIRAGKGTLGKLMADTTIASNMGKTMSNLKEGTAGFKENMDAAQHNFLLRGYFKKKETQARKDSIEKVQLKKEGKKEEKK